MKHDVCQISMMCSAAIFLVVFPEDCSAPGRSLLKWKGQEFEIFAAKWHMCQLRTLDIACGARGDVHFSAQKRVADFLHEAGFTVAGTFLGDAHAA
ncbi:MAG: hypothetical protein ACOCQT_05480 [Desulfovermiculus sp.]